MMDDAARCIMKRARVCRFCVLVPPTPLPSIAAAALGAVWARAHRLQHTHQIINKARKKDNMSKEMKARLRQEYMGLGGAENTVRGCCGCGCFFFKGAAAGGCCVALLLLVGMMMPCVGWQWPAGHARACASFDPPRRPTPRLPHPPIQQAMSSNYFLWIAVAIASLAVMSKMIGAI
jgi:hypothetical protein